MVKSFLLLSSFALSVLSCNMAEKQENQSVATKNKKLAKKENDVTATEQQSPLANQHIETNSKAKILNGIIIHESGGLKIERAFLSFEDGSLVPKTNRTELGKPVYLHLLVKYGWKQNYGMVSIDASEKIVSDKGEVVLNADNLFKDTHAITETDARNIYLEATITKTGKDINYFVVTFRVWDKLGEAEVNGSYKLYIEENAGGY